MGIGIEKGYFNDASKAVQAVIQIGRYLAEHAYEYIQARDEKLSDVGYEKGLSDGG